MYSLPSQPMLSLTPANIFKLAYEYWHSDLGDCSKRFLCHTLVPEEVMSGGPCFCFLCLLCQRFPATSCTFSVRYCLWHKRHSQQSWHAVPEAVFGILPWWLRGREGQVKDDISAWLSFFCIFLTHPRTHTNTHCLKRQTRDVFHLWGGLELVAISLESFWCNLQQLDFDFCPSKTQNANLVELGN